MNSVLAHAASSSNQGGMEVEVAPDPKQFTYADLEVLTNNFSEENFIERTQYCKVYRGKISQDWNDKQEQHVTVKIFTDTIHYLDEKLQYDYIDKNISRLNDEIKFLSQPNIAFHPNLPRLRGFCSEDNKFGVVYDLELLDSLHNLIPKGAIIKWMDAIKIVFGFARLLEFLHGQKPQFLVRNISAAHIMIDQDFNPVLIEFGRLTGGNCSDKKVAVFMEHYHYAAFGYMDPFFFTFGVYTDQCDVYAFGVLVRELLMKCTVDGAEGFDGNPGYFLHTYVCKLIRERPQRCIIPESFVADPDFDYCDCKTLLTISELCLNEEHGKRVRPRMSDVVEQLKSLHVVRNYAEIVLARKFS